MTTTPGLDAYLAQRPDRCPQGFAQVQHDGGLCSCAGANLKARGQAVTSADEWHIFTAAIRQAAAQSPDGKVHQTAVRPLIAAIPPKHRGLLYRRARNEGLLVEAGWEQSTDIAGRNGDKQQRYYELRSAA